MSKAAVIFWSQTGNTEQMANAIADGIREGGMEVDVLNVADTTPADAVKYAKIALGCPAMGAEVLEETEFDPFFTELESKISGLKVALFGSYGWGDGQWMRDWVQRTNDANAVIYTDEGLIINETPDGFRQQRRTGSCSGGYNASPSPRRWCPAPAHRPEYPGCRASEPGSDRG